MLIRCCAFVLLATQVLSCTPTPDDGDVGSGITGVAVDEGSLAGTWGLVIEFATVITLPLFGARNGGSQGLRLVHRRWNATARSYEEDFRWCTDDIFEVEGTKSVVDNATLEKLALVNFASDVDHGRGVYTTRTVLDLWGVRNLPEPLETPLPTKDDYQTPPQSDWMWDEDGDGKPGVTVRLTGNIEAEAYVVSRSAYVLDGAVLAADRIRGLTQSSKSQQHTVAATNRLAVGQSNVRADDEARASWFDMVRLEDDADCADVVAAQQDGRLATRNPLP